MRAGPWNPASIPARRTVFWRRSPSRRSPTRRCRTVATGCAGPWPPPDRRSGFASDPGLGLEAPSCPRPYRFAAIADREAVRAMLEEACRANGVLGTLLIAHEGINGTVAGPHDGVDAI